MRCPILALALALSSGCAATVHEASGFPYPLDDSTPADAAIPADARTISVSGTLFRRLTGRALRRAVVGSSIYLESSVITNSAMSHFAGRWFSADGHTYYWSRFRLGHGRGSYTVHHDRICPSGNGEQCFALFRSADGRFLRHGPGRAAPTLVVIRPIDPAWSPRLS